VLISDGVGLAKLSWGVNSSGDRRRSADNEHCWISPAALRDGTWERFRVIHQLYIETISYENWRTTVKLEVFPPPEKWGQRVFLVVVDEAQAFRNPDTVRARSIAANSFKAGPPKKLVLMSATPVNNSLWDLYTLLSYFIKHDAEICGTSASLLKEKFSDAMRQARTTSSPMPCR